MVANVTDQAIQVLVAEDLDVLRDHFCRLIDHESDMTVLARASSGREVLEHLNRLQPDVILMDIEMDHKNDGIMTAQRALEINPNLRIVFLTVHEDDDTVFNAFETGAVDYVLKTSPAEEIIRGIRSAHAGLSQIRPQFAYKIKNEFSRIRRNQEALLHATLILAQLTPTELEILEHVLKGMSTRTIAEHRRVELSTIKSQINVLLKKFNKKRMKEVTAILKDLNIQTLIHKIREGS